MVDDKVVYSVNNNFQTNLIESGMDSIYRIDKQISGLYICS